MLFLGVVGGTVYTFVKWKTAPANATPTDDDFARNCAGSRQPPVVDSTAGESAERYTALSSTMGA